MRMRKIHKKLLDFSYTFFPDIAREGGARNLRLNCFCMHMPDAWMDGRWMDVRCPHTHIKEGAHTHTCNTLGYTGTHNRGKLGRNIFNFLDEISFNGLLFIFAP